MFKVMYSFRWFKVGLDEVTNSWVALQISTSEAAGIAEERHFNSLDLEQQEAIRDFVSEAIAEQARRAVHGHR